MIPLCVAARFFQIGCNIGLALLLLLIGGICGWVPVIDCRRPAGDRVRGDHRRRAGIRGGRALVPALQDGQDGGQPQVHLLVGGQGLRSVLFPLCHLVPSFLV